MCKYCFLATPSKKNNVAIRLYDRIHQWISFFRSISITVKCKSLISPQV